MKVFIVSIPNEQERREMCEFEMDLMSLFCLRSHLSNDNIISA